METFLNRKTVTRAVLHEYLQLKGVIISDKFEGAQMCQIHRMWRENPEQQVILSFLDFSSALHLLNFWLVGFSGRRLGKSLFRSYENN